MPDLDLLVRAVFPLTTRHWRVSAEVGEVVHVVNLLTGTISVMGVGLHRTSLHNSPNFTPVVGKKRTDTDRLRVSPRHILGLLSRPRH